MSGARWTGAKIDCQKNRLKVQRKCIDCGCDLLRAGGKRCPPCGDALAHQRKLAKDRLRYRAERGASA